MRTKGYFSVVDYEHQGDINRDMARAIKIDPTCEQLHVDISKEDPEADCETCVVTIEFDYSKVNAFKQAFESFDWIEPQEVAVEPEEDVTVYVTKTGKSYKLKQDRKWSYAKKLSEAIAEGMYLYASKK